MIFNLSTPAVKAKGPTASIDPQSGASYTNGLSGLEADVVSLLSAAISENNGITNETSVGDLYNAAGQTWECCAAYDNAVYPNIVPGNGAWHTFNRPLHGTAPDTARPFVPPAGAHVMYKAGEYMTLDDRLYRCLMDTVYAPAEYAPAWEAMA